MVMVNSYASWHSAEGDVYTMGVCLGICPFGGTLGLFIRLCWIICLLLGSTLAPLHPALCPSWIASAGLLCPHFLLCSAKGRPRGIWQGGGEWAWAVCSPSLAPGLAVAVSLHSSCEDRPPQILEPLRLLVLSAWGWEPHTVRCC